MGAEDENAASSTATESITLRVREATGEEMFFKVYIPCKHTVR